MATELDSLKVTLELNDQASAGIADAQAKLDAYTASVTSNDEAVRRASPGYDAVNKKIDSQAVLMASVDRITRQYSTGLQVLRDEAIKGGITAEQLAAKELALGIVRDNALAKARDGAQAMAARLGEQTAATTVMGAATQAANTHLERTGVFTAGATREMIVLGHEMVQGNFSRIPGSMMVMAERTGGLLEILKMGVGAVLSPVGLLVTGFAAAGAAATYFALEAYHQSEALIQLQKNLALTRLDFDGMASAATAAAAAIHKAGPGSTADTLAAAGVLAAVPQFTGSQVQMQDLLKLTGDLATAMGTELPAATKIVAEGLKDPAKEARALADMGFRYLDEASVATIQHLEDTGHAADAQAVFLERLHLSVDVVADSYKRMADEISRAHVADQVKWTSGAPMGAAALTPDASGRPVLTNQSSGAMGIFQVIPNAGTTSRYGYDVSSQDGNILAGLTDLMTKMNAADGNQDIALKNYGGFKTKDPSGYISMVNGANSGSLPPDVSSQIEYWGQVLGLPPDMIALGKKIAVIESHGQQYGGPITAAASLTNFNPQYGPGAPTADQLRQSQGLQVGVNDTLRATSGIQLDGAQAQKLEDTLTRLKAAQQGVAEGTPEWQTFSDRIVKTQSDLVKLQNPLQDVTAKILAEASAMITTIAATDQGAAAAMRAAAAAEAQAKGAKGSGEQIAVLTNAILNKNAAQAADQGAKVIQGLHDQALAAAEVVNAEGMGYREQFYADLDGKVQKATVSLRAAADATTDPQIKAVLDDEIRQIGLLTYAAADLATKAKEADQIRSGQQTLDYMQKELSLVTATTDVRERELAAFRELQSLIKNDHADASNLTETQQALIQQAQDIASTTAALRDQQAAFNDIRNMATQAFDQVGNAIVQAFVNGNGAAVNFGNIARSAVASVAQEVLKLAIINPVLKAALGGSGTTLGGVFSLGGLAAGGGVAGGASGSSGFGMGTLSNLYSIAKGGYSLIGGGLDGGSYLGLGAGIDGFFGVGGSTLVSAGGATSGLTVPLAAADGFATAGGSVGAASAGFLGTGASLGAWGGGIGAGFAAGSLLGGYIQGQNHLTGPAPMIGAGVGALGGAALGTLILPGVGTVIGGIAGGLLGGAGGGFIGPHTQNAWSSTGVGLDNGRIVLGNSYSQIDSTNRAAYQAQADAINSLGVNTVSLGGVSQLGQNTPGGFQDPSKAGDLSAVFGNLRFSSSNDNINSAIGGKSFDDLQQLKDIVQFVGTTMPTLIASSKPAESSFVQGLNAINTAFGNAIQSANNLGISADGLATAQSAAVDKYTASTYRTYSNTLAGFSQRYDAAAGVLAGDPAAAQRVALAQFDQSAVDQRTAFAQQMADTFGVGVTQATWYASDIAKLETTLGEERLAIVQQYNDKLAQAASGPITNLTAYALKLQTGSTSPLSPQDQLKLVSGQFATASASASAGNFASLGTLSTYADSFLNASRNVNGSGAAYVADFQKVLDTLNSVSAVTPDTLTASVLTSETRTQTAILVDNLQALKDEVTALRLQFAQSASTPAQLAA